ncbi:MAG TPA: hypothetical protein VKM72_27085 [Thermoanaerobaculia bacterium]|nr:hypothetical protein [Thermoanaerobaculia bacterium]
MGAVIVQRMTLDPEEIPQNGLPALIRLRQTLRSTNPAGEQIRVAYTLEPDNDVWFQQSPGSPPTKRFELLAPRQLPPTPHVFVDAVQIVRGPGMPMDVIQIIQIVCDPVCSSFDVNGLQFV